MKDDFKKVKVLEISGNSTQVITGTIQGPENMEKCNICQSIRNFNQISLKYEYAHRYIKMQSIILKQQSGQAIFHYSTVRLQLMFILVID